jgi:hypothetical protein
MIEPKDIPAAVEALREAYANAEKEACNEEHSTEWLGRYAAYHEALPIIEAHQSEIERLRTLLERARDTLEQASIHLASGKSLKEDQEGLYMIRRVRGHSDDVSFTNSLEEARQKAKDHPFQCDIIFLPGAKRIERKQADD